MNKPWYQHKDPVAALLFDGWQPSTLSSKNEYMELDNLKTRDELIAYLEKWSHRISVLKRIGHAADLHDAAEILADELLRYSSHRVWKEIKLLP